MTVVDTSAWIEFLRGTGSSVCDEVDRLLGDDLAITDPIVMEVLSGSRDERQAHQLRGLLGKARLVHCIPSDYVSASVLYRRCRTNGETVRRMIDCLIAAVAIRTDLAILHNDKEFDVLARYTELAVHRP